MRVAASTGTSNIGLAEIIDESMYQRLRSRANTILQRETYKHRLEPDDLVQEAFLRIARREAPLRFHDRAHLLAVATIVMRCILIDYARSASSPRRWRCVTLDSEPQLPTESADDAFVIHDALQRLATRDARLYWIVEMRFFWGLGVEEVASALSISSRTVKRQWTAARVWLRTELGKTHSARPAMQACPPHIVSSRLPQQDARCQQTSRSAESTGVGLQMMEQVSRPRIKLPQVERRINTTMAVTTP
jgi:RNA polymerase sigma-70 factor, ECF subfamily